MAARFDADTARSRRERVGDGTPIHLTIPLRNPWVPLRILALGKDKSDIVRADVYLLTDSRPSLFPMVHPGLSLRHSAPASPALMRDLRADKGMDWMPQTSMWLTNLAVDGAAATFSYDLAVVAGDPGRPSRNLGDLPWFVLGAMLWVSGAAALARRRLQ
jgi:hypothetical protein